MKDCLIKCKKCKHYYAIMIGPGGAGYNPYPCCQLYTDTGKHPNMLTQECFEKRTVRKKVK